MRQRDFKWEQFYRNEIQVCVCVYYSEVMQVISFTQCRFRCLFVYFVGNLCCCCFLVIYVSAFFQHASLQMTPINFACLYNVIHFEVEIHINIVCTFTHLNGRFIVPLKKKLKLICNALSHARREKNGFFFQVVKTKLPGRKQRLIDMTCFQIVIMRMISTRTSNIFNRSQTAKFPWISLVEYRIVFSVLFFDGFKWPQFLSLSLSHSFFV